MEQHLNLVKQANISIFEFFNHLFGKPIFDNVMITAHYIADPHLLYYHFIFIAILGSLMLFRVKKDHQQLKDLMIDGVSASITFIFSLFSLILVFIFKNYVEAMRPFCSLEDSYNLTIITKNLICTQSFPSGHTTLTTIFIVSFWPIFNKYFKIISILMAIIIFITRMSSGAHYPVDIIGALAIALPLSLYIRAKTELYITKHINKVQW